MYDLLIVAALAASTPASMAQQATASATPAEAERDAKCLTLSLLGASAANGDADKMKTAIAESWYFLGRIDSAAPGQNLNSLLTRVTEQLQNDAHLKELGSSCDALFVSRGADLRNLGKKADKPSS